MQNQLGSANDVRLTTGHLVTIAARYFAKLSESRLKAHGFGAGQVPVLVTLAELGVSNQRDLAKLAKVEQPPMAQMLDRMEREGLIVRSPDPQDGRSRQISVTDEALSRLPDVIETVLQGNNQALSGFSKDEVDLLINFLLRLNANLERMTSKELRSQEQEEAK